MSGPGGQWPGNPDPGRDQSRQGQQGAPQGQYFDPRAYPRPGFSYSKNSNGTLILVLGILSLVVCPLILGPTAWIMGNSSLKDIEAGVMDPGEKGLVTAGKVLGIVATVLAVLGCCLYAGFVGMALSLPS